MHGTLLAESILSAVFLETERYAVEALLHVEILLIASKTARILCNPIWPLVVVNISLLTVFKVNKFPEMLLALWRYGRKASALNNARDYSNCHPNKTMWDIPCFVSLAIHFNIGIYTPAGTAYK